MHRGLPLAIRRAEKKAEALYEHGTMIATTELQALQSTAERRSVCTKSSPLNSRGSSRKRARA